MGKLMGIKFQMIPWSYLMGNHMCRSGFISEPAAPSRAAAPIIKVIQSDGLVKIYDRPIHVSALTVKFPRHKVCSSDSLYIGQKISALPEDDELQLGHTYFLLPIHFFQSVLTFVTVTSFAASKAAASSNCQLFEIQKTESGFLRIRVRDEFISRLMMMRKAEEDDQMITKTTTTTNDDDDHNNNNTRTGSGYNNTRTNIEKEKREDHHQEEEMMNSSSSSSRKLNKSDKSRVCTTPELQKEYRQLVLIGRRRWKPKLDMIKESRNSEKKSSSSSSRKVVLIPASFRLKKRSSISSSSSITSTTSAPTDNNNMSSSSSSKSSSRSHKTKKKKSSLQSSSEPPPPAHHHVPIFTSSTSTTTTTTTTASSTKPPPAATKHKVKSSKRVYS